MKNKTKLTISVVLLSIMLTGCAEQEAQSNDPNAFAKVTYSNSYPNKNESKPIEESSDVAINGDVMWGLGKTVDEVSEKYGSANGNVQFFTFENGYGKYVFDDSCYKIGEISAKDFLVGDLSTVTLDNIAEKCGFDVFQYNPDPDEETLYDEYKFAYCEHPDYDNVSISIMYNRENGFDETASFMVSLNSETPAITDDFINTLNSVIDTAADVDALKSGIRSADTDVIVFGVQAFENPTAFIENNEQTAGTLADGAVILVEFSDGSCYITTRGERTTELVPKPFMLAHIVQRADSVEQLKAELDGYARGGSDKAVGSVTLYQDSEAANAGDDSGESIIHNGDLVAHGDALKKGGFLRVDLNGGKGWFIMPLDWDNV